MGKLTGNNWIWFFALMLLVTLGARQCGQQSAQYVNEAELSRASEQSAPAAQIFTFVTRQSAEGVTEKQMDSAFIENVGEWIAERAYANAVAKQAKNSGVIVERASPEAVIVETGGKRLGVIRLRSQGFTPSVTIMGLDGADMVRVSCISNILQDVAVSQGPCAAKVKEVFGASIGR